MRWSFIRHWKAFMTFTMAGHSGSKSCSEKKGNGSTLPIRNANGDSNIHNKDLPRIHESDGDKCSEAPGSSKGNACREEDQRGEMANPRLFRKNNYRISMGQFTLLPNEKYDWEALDGKSLYSDQIPDFTLQDKWRILFDKFDPEGFGEIPWENFYIALKSPEFETMLEPGKIQILEDVANEFAKTKSSITFQHFVNVMSGKRSRSFKCAVHHRDREVWSESDFHLFQLGYQPRVKRMARLIADEFLTDERDRKYYADHYRCLPPPLFIISVTLIELGFFTYYTVWHGEISSSGPLPIDSIFVYRPDKRQEVWRFVFYMVLHAGWVHLMFNLLVQLLVGLPLEMVHGSTRIGCVYMAGVLAGSLGTSVFDPDVYLVGASGGVYALLAAHLANVLLNYNNMEFGLLRLLGVFLIASADVGFAIYDRYAASPMISDGSAPPVSYVAHLTGALAGLTIGLLVLKNFEMRLREQLMWWLALGVYAACTLFAVLFNIFHPIYP